jgi:hypothetical protein
MTFPDFLTFGNAEKSLGYQFNMLQSFMFFYEVGGTGIAFVSNRPDEDFNSN